ncbi:MAG: hypothetical protein H5T85_03590 [Actinobacteria bacterium]|nr:hypothetical protein [Actinomycetota bacterium]
MQIEGYSFGCIKIDSKKYRSDVIVFPEKVRENWWRKSGHLVVEVDIEEILEYKPEVLVIGTGAYGCMKVDESARNKLELYGIECVIRPTLEAVKEYNRLKEDKKTVGAFHLTC